MALNPKQQRFVDEYLIDMNATQAATRAGYSQKTAYAQGQRLLKHAEVCEAVKAGREKLATKAALSAEKVLEDIERVRSKAEADGQLQHALKASELQGRHLGMFKDKLEHSGNIDIGERILAARRRAGGNNG